MIQQLSVKARAGNLKATPRACGVSTVELHHRWAVPGDSNAFVPDRRKRLHFLPYAELAQHRLHPRMQRFTRAMAREGGTLHHEAVEPGLPARDRRGRPSRAATDDRKVYSEGGAHGSRKNAKGPLSCLNASPTGSSCSIAT